MNKTEAQTVAYKLMQKTNQPWHVYKIEFEPGKWAYSFTENRIACDHDYNYNTKEWRPVKGKVFVTTYTPEE